MGGVFGEGSLWGGLWGGPIGEGPYGGCLSGASGVGGTRWGGVTEGGSPKHPPPPPRAGRWSPSRSRRRRKRKRRRRRRRKRGRPPPARTPRPGGCPGRARGGRCRCWGGVAAPLLLRGETERLVREVGRARPLQRLPHLKRVRGGPGGAALLLCLDSQLGPGRGADDDVTNDVTEATTGRGSTYGTADTTAAADVTESSTGRLTGDTDTADVTEATAGPGSGCATGDADTAAAVTEATAGSGSGRATGDTDTGDVAAGLGPDAVSGNAGVAAAAPLPPLRVLLGPGVCPRGLGAPFRVKVPGRPPARGAETAAATAASLWPWVRRGGAAAAPSESPPPLDAAEATAASAAMRAALAAARRGARRGMVPAGAAAVEPATGRVLATAHDGRRGEHPLAHAAIACLAAVARRRRRRGGEAGEAGYLCAGCDVYLTREPCALCAMALVHARVRRVLFGVPAPQGALGTRYGLHGRRALNHRYRVYGGVAARRCARLARLDRAAAAAQ
ncbi:probable inactive tRNA-specific adenosine deaminase-like protein 3 [Accipiter gentilis]|uniref:probable inactive tRNA-specific adenosine deaminase-like protein 3 n=1 Tax=Astur gentilis TaxID=8957 RepID=UPI00211064D3|nr:probable inactive tRNA-specific adenosine deaminase-like protein 3 [Accipiter gentilis]